MRISLPGRRGAAAVLAGATALAAVVLLQTPANATSNVFTYSGPVVAIPDVSTGTADLPVSGLSGTINKVILRFDGSSCTTTVGATTVGIDHSYVSDLRISLIAPDGTSVVVVNRVDSSGNNFCQTVLDDQATRSIGDVVSSDAPYTGTFRPSSPLSAFRGHDPNGTWHLKAEDLIAGDSGHIRAFSLIVDSGAVNPKFTVSNDRPYRNELIVLCGHHLVPGNVYTAYAFGDTYSLHADIDGEGCVPVHVPLAASPGYAPITIVSTTPTSVDTVLVNVRRAAIV